MTVDLQVYGANCTFSSPIEKAIPHPQYLIPVCPFCFSPLFQEEKEKWWDSIKEYEENGHKNYYAFNKWIEKQQKCWREMKDAVIEFELETGQKVEL